MYSGVLIFGSKEMFNHRVSSSGSYRFNTNGNLRISDVEDEDHNEGSAWA